MPIYTTIFLGKVTKWPYVTILSRQHQLPKTCGDPSEFRLESWHRNRRSPPCAPRTWEKSMAPGSWRGSFGTKNCLTSDLVANNVLKNQVVRQRRSHIVWVSLEIVSPVGWVLLKLRLHAQLPPAKPGWIHGFSKRCLPFFREVFVGT